MAKRLFLICILATAFACKSKSKGDKEETRVSDGGNTATAVVGRDAVENALMGLGIPGRVQRFDLNEAKNQGRIKLAQIHLLRDMLVVESARPDKGKIMVYAIGRRGGLTMRWMSRINEPTLFPATENGDAVLLTSLHFLHALEKQGGRRVLQFIGGAMDGVERPHFRFPFRPTGAAAAQHDTFYAPNLGSAHSNKNLDAVSLLTGDIGWGYRTSSDIMNSVIVGGSSADPKLYFMTRTGHVTCMQAMNYGFAPAGPNWEMLLDGAVKQDMFLTDDNKGYIGALYIVDEDGTVYCLDRITGRRRWTHDTQRRPTGGCKVFGDVCVVKMASGLIAFDRDNVLYELATDSAGGSKTVVTARGSQTIEGVSFEIQNEVLFAAGKGSKRFRVNGGARVARASLRGGDVISIGRTDFTVADRGSRPLWRDLDYDRVVGRVGDNLIVARGKSLLVIDARTGERTGAGVDFSAARFVPTNTFDKNIYAVGGDAVVYALFAR